MQKYGFTDSLIGGIGFIAVSLLCMGSWFSEGGFSGFASSDWIALALFFAVMGGFFLFRAGRLRQKTARTLVGS
jgi:hypothetical protein